LVKNIFRKLSNGDEEANRAESRKDFIHKVGVVEKEASVVSPQYLSSLLDQSPPVFITRDTTLLSHQYWLELFEDADIGNQDECRWLLNESGELVAIFTSIGKTAKRNQ
jgi:hypothetical protein